MNKRSLSDENLVKAFLEGDEDAFTQLYERYRLRIYSIAFQIMRNPEEAQDAAQEVFIKLYRSLDKWDVRISKLSTWIHRLAVNHSIDYWRVRSRRAESQLSGDNGDLILPASKTGSSAGSPYTAARNREEISLIRSYIKKLPDLQKKTFIGRYFKELKLVEIAEQENCKIGAVKSALHRATHAVRHFLMESRSLSLRKVESHA